MPKRVLIATFSIWLKNKRTPINGMLEPMLRYFNEKKIPVDIIDGMHPGSSDVITIFERHNALVHISTSLISRLLKPLLLLFNTNQTQLLFKVRDFLAVLEWAIFVNTRYDLFIGLESIYTAAGILLKKLRIVKTVVYYVSDYAPNRYGNSKFNDVYLFLDRFCCYHSDYIWDVSLAFHPARIAAGLDVKRSAPIIHVPNALFPEQICPVRKSSIIPHSLVFAGTLNIYNGPDVAVETTALVKRKFPDVHLHIYGTNGNDQARVTNLMEKLKVKDNVTFHGLVTNAIDLSHIINRYSIGLAPYIERKDSHRAFGDATKLRLYAGSGLTFITTYVPPLGKDLADIGACVRTEDSPEALSKTIIQLFSDPVLHEKIRRKAIAYAATNTWNNTYCSAFKKMKI